MLVVSCHDVDALRDALLRKQEGLVYAHLAAMQDRHVLVMGQDGASTDRLDVTGVRTDGDCGVRVTRVTQLWNDLVSSARLVRVECDAGLQQSLISRGVTRSGACCASAFLAASADVMVAISQDVPKVRDSLPDGIGEICTLQEYGFSRAATLEREQACCVGGRPSAELASRIIRPLVMWAKKITLIDRYLGRRLAGLPDDGFPSWKADRACERYQAFLQLLAGTWSKEGKASPWCGQLVLCTEFCPSLGDSKRQKELIMEAARECLADEAESAPPRRVEIGVQLKKDVGHDRYLLPGWDLVVGFTHGFDILDGGVCMPCDVYVRRLGRDSRVEAVSKVLTAREM